MTLLSGSQHIFEMFCLCLCTHAAEIVAGLLVDAIETANHRYFEQSYNGRAVFGRSRKTQHIHGA